MERDYFYFVGEWGNLLDRVTNVTGKYPGEIDRCFWGALGSHNFLQGCRSRYKSFMFIENENNQVGRKSARYYDGVDRAGNYLVTVELESL
jgi:hypothetical protein